MKIYRHALAFAFAAGLAGAASSFPDGQPSPAVAQAGWYIAKRAEKNLDLSENAAEATQAFSQAAGATIGAASGAVIGLKIGLAAGVVGGVIGAGLGAL